LRSSRICPDGRPAARLLLLVCVLPVFCAISAAAFALDPSRLPSQYVHDHWGEEKGFLGGGVTAISQSKDGYLWIGTERGLVRFDGTSFELIQTPIAGELPIGAVRGLATDAEGTLWVRLDGTRLLRYRNGVFDDAVRALQLRTQVITAMATDPSGEVMIGLLENICYRMHRGTAVLDTSPSNIAGTITALAETRDGTQWIGTRDDGLYRKTGTGYQLVSGDGRDRNVNALLPASNGGLWIGTDHGLEQWDGNTVAHDLFEGPLKDAQILSIASDRDNNLWLGTDRGLARVSVDGSVAFLANSASGHSAVAAAYLDQQGSLWYGGVPGLERLTDGSFTSFTTSQGLLTNRNGPIYVDDDGRLWTAPLTGGLYWYQDGRAHSVVVEGLGRDVVYSIDGRGNQIWIGRQNGGLTELTLSGDAVTARTYDRAHGLSQNSVYSVIAAQDGSAWAGTLSGGITRVHAGDSAIYTSSNGLSSNTINAIADDRSGSIWVGTPAGLDQHTPHGWKAFTSSDGLPSSDVRVLLADREGVLWIATANGLCYLQNASIHTLASVPEMLREPIAGMAEDDLGTLWFSTSDHVFSANRELLLRGTLSDTDVIAFGMRDGLPGTEGIVRSRSVVSDSRRRIWLSTGGGIAMTAAKASMLSLLPIAARIDSISSGDVLMPASNGIRFEKGTNQVTFSFAPIALSDLDRIQFRYRLDGFDTEWSAPTRSRQVTFTNLPPRTYRFRVLTSNALGLWNGPEAALTITVEPAYWQTWWFRIVVVLGGVLLLLTAYRLRMYQIVRGMNQRFQERLAERTRIAQELHDTLLQGVLSASMQLDLAEDQVPEGSAAKARLQRVLELMQRVTEEGRAALRGLRVHEEPSASLELAFSRCNQELSASEKTSFHVIANTSSRPLRPIIRDEIYRIGREAITNAFRHARADSVEVEIEYASSHLRLLVRDDGCGIDPEVLAQGREGHWGLIGMRERSEKIGGRLRLRSRVTAGTEVELTIPGIIAFDGHRYSRIVKWYRGLGRRPRSTEHTDRKG
jgi:ligand-binding sensor domain-containing protein/signal transduction histidine kinase